MLNDLLALWNRPRRSAPRRRRYHRPPLDDESPSSPSEESGDGARRRRRGGGGGGASTHRATTGARGAAAGGDCGGSNGTKRRASSSFASKACRSPRTSASQSSATWRCRFWRARDRQDAVLLLLQSEHATPVKTDIIQKSDDERQPLISWTSREVQHVLIVARCHLIIGIASCEESSPTTEASPL